MEYHCSPATSEFFPAERQERERGKFGSVSSSKMACHSPTDSVLAQCKKAGKQGKEMLRPEDEKKPAAAKITESAKQVILVYKIDLPPIFNEQVFKQVLMFCFLLQAYFGGTSSP